MSHQISGKFRSITIIVASLFCLNTHAQTLNNGSTFLRVTLTTNSDSNGSNEDFVLRGGGSGVPTKDFFVGNNDNPDGTTIVLGTGAGANTHINGHALIENTLSVGGAGLFTGIDNNGQVISNIAPGTAATDAMSVSQLEASVSTQAAINNSQTTINNAQAITNQALQDQTAVNRRISSTGIAIVAAAAALPALETGKRFGIGAGVGTYDGRSAIALGMVARWSPALQLRLHMGTGSSGKVAVGAGGTWAW